MMMEVLLLLYDGGGVVAAIWLSLGMLVVAVVVQQLWKSKDLSIIEMQIRHYCLWCRWWCGCSCCRGCDVVGVVVKKVILLSMIMPYCIRI